MRRKTGAVAELERAGHPLVRTAVDDAYDLGEEFFRWEFATAVAGSILGIHPFDQPDVEASAETPIFTGEGIRLFTDEANAAALTGVTNGQPTLTRYLGAHLNRLRRGDYFALLAFTCDDAVDVPVPGQRYTFGVVKAAQARGDFRVLVERNRRALRVHLGSDVAAGLRTLHRAFTAALEDRR